MFPNKISWELENNGLCLAVCPDLGFKDSCLFCYLCSADNIFWVFLVATSENICTCKSQALSKGDCVFRRACWTGWDLGLGNRKTWNERVCSTLKTLSVYQEGSLRASEPSPAGTKLHLLWLARLGSLLYPPAPHGDVVSAGIGPALWGCRGSWKEFQGFPLHLGSCFALCWPSL